MGRKNSTSTSLILNALTLIRHSANPTNIMNDGIFAKKETELFSKVQRTKATATPAARGIIPSIITSRYHFLLANKGFLNL